MPDHLRELPRGSCCGSWWDLGCSSGSSAALAPGVDPPSPVGRLGRGVPHLKGLVPWLDSSKTVLYSRIRRGQLAPLNLEHPLPDNPPELPLPWSPSHHPFTWQGNPPSPRAAIQVRGLALGSDLGPSVRLGPLPASCGSSISVPAVLVPAFSAPPRVT